MANSTRLNHILSNAELLGLKVQKLSWGEEFLGGLFDFRVKTNLFGEETIGIGIDQNEEVAFLKAFSESVERAYCKKNNIRSHGVSAHWCKESAKENSLCELIERDMFLCHFLTGKGAKRVENSDIQEVNAGLSSKGCRLKVFQLSTLNNYNVFVTIGENGALGNIIGLGASIDSESALKKSMIECLFRLIAEAGRSSSDLNKDVENPIEHYLYHLESPRLVNSMLLKNSSFSSKVINKSADIDVEWEELGNLNEIIPGLKLCVLRGRTKSLQGMYYGNTSEQKVNFSRLKEFFGELLTFDDLETMVHPVG
ncbi:MAG: hypothetical protein ACJAS4_001895 [Bacteriovoracaceae bacterium]|jgi:hypothetical protein